MKVYKVNVYQEVDLAENIVKARNEQHAMHLVESMNYKTGAGLKYVGNYRFNVEIAEDYCLEHQELEYLDDVCYEQMTGEKP